MLTVRVPIVIRLSEADAWQRFAASGGFESFGANRPLVAPFGGVGSDQRLENRQTARLLEVLGGERTRDIVRRVEEGQTLEEVGRIWNITRQRVQQIAERWFAAKGTSLRELRRSQREARETEEHVERLREAPLCVVCCEPVLMATVKGPSRRRTCSAGCAEELQKHRWRYDETRRRQIRLAQARWVLDHPEKNLPESQLNYARRVVENPNMPFTRRFTCNDPEVVRRAVGIVRELLPRPRSEVVGELRRQGIEPSASLLARIRRELGVVTKRHGFGPGSTNEWLMPETFDAGRVGAR